jgi:hypothetical protein
MFKKTIRLTLIFSLALIAAALAQQPADPSGKRPARGMNQGMAPGGAGQRMGPGTGMHQGMGMGRMAIWKDKELLQKAGITEEQANKIRHALPEPEGQDQVRLGSSA